MAGALFREEDHAAIAAALATDETLREAVATYMATAAAITRANGGVAPVMVLPQLAPSPDYRTSEPAPEGPVEAPPACFTCSRPLARFAGPGPETGWTCVVCDDPAAREPAPVEICSCDEALALRARVERLEAETAHLRAKNRAAEADLTQALEEARVRHAKPLRHAAEKAVLDASHLILDSSLRRIREVEGGCLGDWAAAELARREVARGG